MSDIFISYSKADHALALKLSTFLEAEGWTVWWDRSLGVADLYRDEIMKQLAAARAVITIWTENSVKSDWVRAEAGRAKAEGKLIPVKTTEVAYADIPLPFGEMHTENVGSTGLIRAAIVAQLAKPAATQSPFRQITSTFKYQILTWIGIVGSAITVFGGLSTILEVANWAKELVTHWHELTQMFWKWVLGWIGVKVPKELVPIVSFTLFSTMLVVGGNLSLRTETNSVNSQNVIPVKDKVGILGGGASLYLFTIITLLAIFVTILYFILPYSPPVTNETSLEELQRRLGEEVHRMWVQALFVWAVIVISGICFPVAYLLYSIKDQAAWILSASLLFLFMSGCLLYAPLMGSLGSDSDYLALAVGLSEVGLLPICLMAVILFSPLQQLTRRLAFVVLGVLTLVGLSEISKLNLHQYLQPPKLSDNSLR